MINETRTSEESGLKQKLPLGNIVSFIIGIPFHYVCVPGSMMSGEPLPKAETRMERYGKIVGLSAAALTLLGWGYMVLNDNGGFLNLD